MYLCTCWLYRYGPLQQALHLECDQAAQRGEGHRADHSFHGMRVLVVIFCIVLMYVRMYEHSYINTVSWCVLMTVILMHIA